MELANLRNVGIVAHIDAGKTTVSERILFVAGVEHRVGSVDDGTTVLDWMSQERERGITITAASTRLPWKDCQINLVDTPGHVDFTVEVERCVRVLDAAVLVIDAVAGVQAQSETVWRQMARYGLASIAFVNKCDRVGADYLAAVESLRERLGAPAIPVQYPLYEDGDLRGTIDLVERRALVYDPQGRRPPEQVDVPLALADEVGVLRAELVERLADEDDDLLQRVLEGREPEPAQLMAALRRATISGALVPVLCGAALRHAGVEPLLDAVVAWLPSPLDVPPVRGVDPETEEPLERAADPDQPLAALVYKLVTDAHGDLCFVRIYSGRLAAGDQVSNPRTGQRERVNRIVRMHANDRRNLGAAEAGDVVALIGLKDVKTGDTLCALDAPILLEPLAFPAPVIAMVVEPRATEDRERLGAALARLAREDPTLVVREDEETGQWVVAGMGELHLEITRHRLEREARIPTHVGQPRVAYREAPRRIATGRALVDRTFGGKAVYGGVTLEIAPLSGEEALRVRWAVEEPVPPSAKAALIGALELGGQVGPRFGYPLVGVEIRVVGVESRPGGEAEPGFEQAAGLALREALAAADVALLEPIMHFEIRSPEEFAGGILADLHARRATVETVASAGADRIVTGTVPLFGMFGYSTSVRSLSQGRAGFTMRPAGFGEVPTEELLARGLVWQ